MKTSRCIVLLLVLTLYTPSQLAAARDSGESELPPEPSRAPEQPVGSVEASSKPLAEEPLSPQAREILELIEGEKEALEDASARLETAIGPTAKEEIQREVAKIKQDTEIGILRIQLKYALQESRLESAARIEAVILQLEAPPVRGEPQPRPAPAAESR